MASLKQELDAAEGEARARRIIERIEAILNIGGCGKTEEQLAFYKCNDIRSLIKDYREGKQ